MTALQQRELDEKTDGLKLVNFEPMYEEIEDVKLAKIQLLALAVIVIFYCIFSIFFSIWISILIHDK